MKSYTKSIGIFTALALFLSGCASESKDKATLELGTIPYSLTAAPALIGALSAEKLNDQQFENQIYEAGAFSYSFISYTPTQGKKSWLMGVYYFPESKFDAAQNPNEPPAFGTEVLRENGAVLAIAGPQDSIFDPSSQDGKNIDRLNSLIYKADSYKKKVLPRDQKIVGCYSASLAKDKFYLLITQQSGPYISSKVFINNFEKDSSTGDFYGTYQDGILSGTYYFSSEGMNSRRELFFKRDGDGFYSGYGPVEVVGDFEKLIRPLSLTWDHSYKYEPSSECLTD